MEDQRMKQKQQELDELRNKLYSGGTGEQINGRAVATLSEININGTAPSP